MADKYKVACPKCGISVVLCAEPIEAWCTDSKVHFKESVKMEVERIK